MKSKISANFTDQVKVEASLKELFHGLANEVGVGELFEESDNCYAVLEPDPSDENSGFLVHFNSFWSYNFKEDRRKKLSAAEYSCAVHLQYIYKELLAIIEERSLHTYTVLCRISENTSLKKEEKTVEGKEPAYRLLGEVKAANKYEAATKAKEMYGVDPSLLTVLKTEEEI